MTAREASSRESVAALYDHLSRQVLWSARRRLYRGPTSRLTMHKTLRIPAHQKDEYPLEMASMYINDLALAAVSPEPEPDVLDAGCGFGGTVFRWHERIGGAYDGLTLSPVQWRAASREAESRGVAEYCRFFLRSYDEPLTSRYDVVVVIEALIHSDDLGASLRHLAAALRPGGKLVVVEDMAAGSVDGARADLASLRSLWHLAAVPSLVEYRKELAACGLELLGEADYSSQFEARPHPTLARLERRYRWLRRLAPRRSWRTVLDAYLGGLALERLYLRGAMSYRLLVAQNAA